MTTRQLYILLIVAALAPILSLFAFQYSEGKEQAKRLNGAYQVFPVPIPSDLTFCGEEVPLEKFGVKERLDRELLINSYWGSQTLLVLKRSRSYFQIIDPILERNSIPLDFRYLAVAESALQLGRSSAGAQGIWQWMPSSAQEMGLEVNDAIDERLHLERSTEAACKYLKQAYERFGNWTLVAAAYNRGMNGLARALEDQQVSSFYDLHLNTETSRYVPRILAYKTILEQPEVYGFNLQEKDYYSFPPSRTMKVDSTIVDLQEFAEAMGTSYHVIKSLNPWIKGNSLVVKGRQYQLKTPAG